MCDWLCLYINTPTKTKSNESILMFCPGTTTSAWERGWMAALRTLTSCRRKCRWGKWFYQIFKWEMKSFQMKIVKMIWFLNLSRSPPCCRDRWKAGFDRCWTGGRPPEVRIFILNSLPIFFIKNQNECLLSFFEGKDVEEIVTVFTQLNTILSTKRWFDLLWFDVLMIMIILWVMINAELWL